mmetsp:Transcript_68405/g.154916  ORF Transcript_68405/g.154916 Transcript_68405/m.154916 type:complete len:727 (+) Transcript_68405:62-2242(+)
MHGLIHAIFKEFIVENFGVDAWKQVLAKCHLEDDVAVLRFVQHADGVTWAAIEAAVEIAGVPLDTALELFGSFFVRHVAKQGWARMLRSMGKNFKEFIININDLHHFLERDFRSATFPSFRVEETAEGLRVTYVSQRFLPALALACLRETAVSIFELQVEIRELERSDGSVTWLVVETSPAGTAKKDAIAEEVAPKAGQQPFRFSFQAFHEALASLTKCSVPSCWTTTSAEQVIEKLGPEEDELRPDEAGSSSSDSGTEDQEEGIVMAKRRSHRTFSSGFEHAQAPKDSDLEDAMSDSEADLSPITAFRMDHALPFARGLTEWIRGIPEERRYDLALQLMRSVPAHRVAADWSHLEQLEVASGTFWGDGPGTQAQFDWSDLCFDDKFKCPVHTGPMRFVSHSWSAPQDWTSLMGDRCQYRDVKAAELGMAAKDLAAHHFGCADRWGEVRLWIDKCCIRQDDPDRKRLYIELIEEFLQFCDGLIVIFCWHYFTRLWCVYEWACFLVYHEPEDVTMAGECFYRSCTEQRFLDEVRDFKVSNCQCFVAADRIILSEKIREYYVDDKAFEHFLKFTVIALAGRCLALRAARSRHRFERWAVLAEECGFHELAAGLGSANPAAWREAALALRGNSRRDIQASIQEYCQGWFKLEVAPLIHQERLRCVRGNVLTRMAARRSSVMSIRTNTTISIRSLRTMVDAHAYSSPTMRRGTGSPVRTSLPPMVKARSN